MASNQLIITKYARQDVYEILFYIEHKLFNPKAASDFAIELAEKLEFIRMFPTSQPIVENHYFHYKDIRKTIINNYAIYYRYDSEQKTVTVYKVMHGKRNIELLLNSW